MQEILFTIVSPLELGKVISNNYYRRFYNHALYRYTSIHINHFMILLKEPAS